CSPARRPRRGTETPKGQRASRRDALCLLRLESAGSLRQHGAAKLALDLAAELRPEAAAGRRRRGRKRRTTRGAAAGACAAGRAGRGLGGVRGGGLAAGGLAGARAAVEVVDNLLVVADQLHLPIAQVNLQGVELLRELGVVVVPVLEHQLARPLLVTV